MEGGMVKAKVHGARPLVSRESELYQLLRAGNLRWVVYKCELSVKYFKVRNRAFRFRVTISRS